jgi:hypothetical protein
MTFSKASEILDIKIEVTCNDPRYDLKNVYIFIPSMDKKMYLNYSVERLLGREDYFIQTSVILGFELNKWLGDDIYYDYKYKIKH